MDELTLDDISLILESLAFTKMNFENYPHYPSYEFRLQRLAEVNSAITKVRAMRSQKEHLSGRVAILGQSGK